MHQGGEIILHPVSRLLPGLIFSCTRSDSSTTDSFFQLFGSMHAVRRESKMHQSVGSRNHPGNDARMPPGFLSEAPVSSIMPSLFLSKDR